MSHSDEDGADGHPAERPGRGRRWWPATAFAALVLVGSLVPIPESGSGTSGGSGSTGGLPVGAVVDLVPAWVGLTDPFHLIGYAVLAGLVTLAVGTDRRGVAVAVILATSFGFGIELAQLTVPWRTFAWMDVAVNALGAVIGGGAAALIARRRAARETSPQSADDPPPSG